MRHAVWRTASLLLLTSLSWIVALSADPWPFTTSLNKLLHVSTSTSANPTSATPAPVSSTATLESNPSTPLPQPVTTPVVAGPVAHATWDAAAPWTAPPGTVFPYANLENNLDALLQVQASPHRWISMVTGTKKIFRFVLNCIYTMHKYGGQPHYIVATFDNVSLAECKKRNLPCFRADPYAPHEIEDGDHGFGSHHAVGLWWGKQNLTRDLISRGYNVHGSDVDVVYFRNINQSYDRIFSNTFADGIFAAEEGGPGEPWEVAPPDKSYINMINAGVYALQANERTLDFMTQWTAPEGKMHMDQVFLNNIHTQAYMFCDSHASCRSVQTHKVFGLFRHMSFFPGTSCIQNLVPPDNTTHFCDPRRLYLHFLCTCCWDVKSECWERNKLWFIDNSTSFAPMYSEDPASPLGRHPYMPCEEQVAWANWERIT